MSIMSARMARATLGEAAVLAGVPEICDHVYATFTDEDELASWGPFAFACAPPIARVQAAIAFARGERDAGVRHCERAIRLSDRMDATAHRAWVHLTWGEGLTGSADARPHLEQARLMAEKLRMPEVLARARAAMTSVREAPKAAPVIPTFALERDGAMWTMEHAGKTLRLKDVRGLAMIKALVDSPDRELHVLDLASDPSTEAVDVGDAGEILDARARDAYKKRIAELREDVEEAERSADSTRAARLRYELDALTDQIAAAVGLGGRERRSGSATERARIVVQRRVREAIKKIAEQDPDLGRHLDWSIRTGTFCAYEPSGRR
jgi:hypothetical protein